MRIRTALLLSVGGSLAFVPSQRRQRRPVAISGEPSNRHHNNQNAAALNTTQRTLGVSESMSQASNAMKKAAPSNKNNDNNNNNQPFWAAYNVVPVAATNNSTTTTSSPGSADTIPPSTKTSWSKTQASSDKPSAPKVGTGAAAPPWARKSGGSAGVVNQPMGTAKIPSLQMTDGTPNTSSPPPWKRPTSVNITITSKSNGTTQPTNNPPMGRSTIPPSNGKSMNSSPPLPVAKKPLMNGATSPPLAVAKSPVPKGTITAPSGGVTINKGTSSEVTIPKETMEQIRHVMATADTTKYPWAKEIMGVNVGGDVDKRSPPPPSLKTNPPNATAPLADASQPLPTTQTPKSALNQQPMSIPKQSSVPLMGPPTAKSMLSQKPSRPIPTMTMGPPTAKSVLNQRPVGASNMPLTNGSAVMTVSPPAPVGASATTAKPVSPPVPWRLSSAAKSNNTDSTAVSPSQSPLPVSTVGNASMTDISLRRLEPIEATARKSNRHPQVQTSPQKLRQTNRAISRMAPVTFSSTTEAPPPVKPKRPLTVYGMNKVVNTASSSTKADTAQVVDVVAVSAPVRSSPAVEVPPPSPPRNVSTSPASAVVSSTEAVAKILEVVSTAENSSAVAQQIANLLRKGTPAAGQSEPKSTSPSTTGGPVPVDQRMTAPASSNANSDMLSQILEAIESADGSTDWMQQITAVVQAEQQGLPSPPPQMKRRPPPPRQPIPSNDLDSLARQQYFATRVAESRGRALLHTIETKETKNFLNTPGSVSRPAPPASPPSKDYFATRIEASRQRALLANLRKTPQSDTLNGLNLSPTLQIATKGTPSEKYFSERVAASRQRTLLMDIKMTEKDSLAKNVLPRSPPPKDYFAGRIDEARQRAQSQSHKAKASEGPPASEDEPLQSTPVTPASTDAQIKQGVADVSPSANGLSTPTSNTGFPMSTVPKAPPSGLSIKNSLLSKNETKSSSSVVTNTSNVASVAGTPIPPKNAAVPGFNTPWKKPSDGAIFPKGATKMPSKEPAKFPGQMPLSGVKPWSSPPKPLGTKTPSTVAQKGETAFRGARPNPTLNITTPFSMATDDEQSKTNFSKGISPPKPAAAESGNFPKTPWKRTGAVDSKVQGVNGSKLPIAGGVSGGRSGFPTAPSKPPGSLEEKNKDDSSENGTKSSSASGSPGLPKAPWQPPSLKNNEDKGREDNGPKPPFATAGSSGLPKAPWKPPNSDSNKTQYANGSQPPSSVPTSPSLPKTPWKAPNSVEMKPNGVSGSPPPVNGSRPSSTVTQSSGLPKTPWKPPGFTAPSVNGSNPSSDTAEKSEPPKSPWKPPGSEDGKLKAPWKPPGSVESKPNGITSSTPPSVNGSTLPSANGKSTGLPKAPWKPPGSEISSSSKPAGMANASSVSQNSSALPKFPPKPPTMSMDRPKGISDAPKSPSVESPPVPKSPWKPPSSDEGKATAPFAGTPSGFTQSKSSSSFPTSSVNASKQTLDRPLANTPVEPRTKKSNIPSVNGESFPKSNSNKIPNGADIGSKPNAESQLSEGRTLPEMIALYVDYKKKIADGFAASSNQPQSSDKVDTRSRVNPSPQKVPKFSVAEPLDEEKGIQLVRIFKVILAALGTTAIPAILLAWGMLSANFVNPLEEPFMPNLPELTENADMMIEYDTQSSAEAVGSNTAVDVETNTENIESLPENSKSTATEQPPNDREKEGIEDAKMNSETAIKAESSLPNAAESSSGGSVSDAGVSETTPLDHAQSMPTTPSTPQEPVEVSMDNRPQGLQPSWLDIVMQHVNNADDAI